METSKMESTDIRQVEALLQAQLNNVAEESDKVRLIAMIDDYFSLLKGRRACQFCNGCISLIVYMLCSVTYI